MESEQHRKNTDQLTYRTTSKKLCYWCLTPGCLIKRGHSLLKKQKLNREELDWITIHMCAAYGEKLEAQIKDRNKTEEKIKVQEQVASNS